jgi:uncharacterized protein
VIVGVMALLPQVASAQAIDCFKATNAVEKTICTDSTLSALDVKMASLYRDAIKHATPEQQQGIAAQHQRWVGTRNACGKQKDVRACVMEAYTARNTQLTSYASGEATLPTGSTASAGSRGSSTRSAASAPVPPVDSPAAPSPSAKASSSPKTGTHVYTCSDQSTLKVTYTKRGKARVQYDASDMTLPHVKSASGVRYKSGTTSVWNKGNDVTFERAGKKLTCSE